MTHEADVWFDLQVYTRRGNWVTISDHNTREDAEARAKGLDLIPADYRVKRMVGLDPR